MGDPGHRGIAVEVILALGRIGGWQAVQAIAGGKTKNPKLNEDINDALGVSKSPDAVAVLIQRSRSSETSAGVCDALLTLTHYGWCETPGQNQAEFWTKWWAEHQLTTSIYGDDECIVGHFVMPLP
jgi:hypothetical protein